MEKRRLGFWEIWNMSFGFLGIQMGFALQNANVSRIFQTLGAEIDDIPALWVAAPLTGLIVQPIIGYFSDRTWTKLGRRKPYFLIGALLASVALFIMPNSPALWFAAGMLWILDASINIDGAVQGVCWRCIAGQAKDVRVCDAELFHRPWRLRGIKASQYPYAL
jgi:maltose/moltooligosaccharide transporter